MTKPRGLRLLLAAALAAAIGSMPLSSVLACSCGQVSTAESMDFADVAFIGTAIGAEQPPSGPVVSSADPVRYTFAVEGVFKGPLLEPQIAVTTSRDGASCGTTFAMEERWLVFAAVGDGEPSTGLCSGNVLLLGGPEDAAVLEAIGAPIATPEPAPAEPAAVEVPLAILLLGVVVAVVAGVSAWAFALEPRRRVR